MANEIAGYMDRLRRDPWRSVRGFSEDVGHVLEIVCNDSAPIDERLQALDDWLARYQPCLFGRIAARDRSISYCLLSEQQLRDSDESIHDAIQTARLRWLRQGFEGKSSSFVIVAASETLASADPSDHVKAIALRLAGLYLEREVQADMIELDKIYLEKPGSPEAVWEWPVGINYFSAQADGRWWHDHRIPAGIAFSMNSVGHMVKSGRLNRALQDLNQVLDVGSEESVRQPIDSLEKALDFAMRTINQAATAVSGRATWLIEQRSETSGRCPIELPRFLRGKDPNEYRGWYHTDFTIPSEYFRPDVERPPDIRTHDLDFTYLFDNRLDNPDYRLMGEGRRIRSDAARSSRSAKRLRGVATEIPLSSTEMLKRALRL